MRAATRLPKTPRTQEQKQKYLEGQARKMDRNPTAPEAAFENMLISIKIKYETQKIVHGKIFDFYVPEKNIIFEIDGNYWHGYGLKIEEMNEIQRKSFYNDQKKSVLAEGAGFKLVRIWEHELEDENYLECEKKVRNILK